MRPLYLSAEDPMHVRLDGPALSVIRSGRARQIFPIQRLSRVIVSGDAYFETGALLACTDAGVSITFLQKDGALRARLIGSSSGRDDLLQMLRDVSERSDWSERYGDWCCAMERRHILPVIKFLKLDLRVGREPVKLLACVDHIASMLADADAAMLISRRLRSLLGGHVTEVFGRVKLLGADLPGPGQPVDLHRDLMRILSWDLQAMRIGWLRRRQRWQEKHKCRPTPIRESQIVRLYEDRSGRMDQEIRTTLLYLHKLLRELY